MIILVHIWFKHRRCKAALWENSSLIDLFGGLKGQKLLNFFATAQKTSTTGQKPALPEKFDQFDSLWADCYDSCVTICCIVFSTNVMHQDPLRDEDSKLPHSCIFPWWPTKYWGTASVSRCFKYDLGDKMERTKTLTKGKEGILQTHVLRLVAWCCESFIEA